MVKKPYTRSSNKIIFLPVLACLILSWYSCGNKGSAPEPEKKPELQDITLITPTKSEVCTNGVILSATKSMVTFNWKPISGATNYVISVTDLLTSQTRSDSTTNSSMNIVLDRNTPYAWGITSKTAAGIAKSEVWRFYNAGAVTTGYAPFPATAVAPLQGDILVYTNDVSLRWNSASVDNNIKNYDVYFGTTPDPPLYKKEVVNTYTDRIPVTKTNYFWRVVTRDANGNTSDSQLFQFTVR